MTVGISAGCPTVHPETTPGGSRPRLTRWRWGDLALAATVFVGVLVVLVGTSYDIAMGFDEAFTIRRELVLADWFVGLVDPPEGVSRREFFTRPVLEEFWRFSRKEPDGHPPFYALVGLAGWFPTRTRLEPLTAFRFGPMLLTAATCAVVYLHLSRRHGRMAGLAAPVLLLMMPRVFTHAHYAHYDMPVTCLWLLTQVAFIRAVETGRGAALFGLLLGLACGTKFTGWFALAPPLAWTALFEWGPNAGCVLTRSRRGDGGTPARPTGAPWRATRCLMVGVPVAMLTLYAIQPPWWSDPLRGVHRFLVSNLTRERTVPVPSLYLGQIYPFALPWHNTIVLTAITTPVLTLLLGLCGIAAILRRVVSEPLSTLWTLSFATLLVVRALPNAPGHDVERLLLPSLASLAVLAGIGAGWLVRRTRRRLVRSLGYALFAGAVAESALGFVDYYPYNLSYYNRAIGGLPGAERLGFEPTYYWDSLGPEFARWACAQSRLDPGPLEMRFPFNHLSILYLRAWGELPADLHLEGMEPTERPLYVVQRNLGVYAPWDAILEREARPLFAISRQGVDLLRVYSAEDAERAYRASLLEAPAMRRAAGGQR